MHKESRPPQVLLLHLGGKLLHVESSDDDIEILQHHEGDEGLVEVEAVIGALLQPPESKSCSSKPAEPAQSLFMPSLLVWKMTPTSWRGKAGPPPQGQPPHFQPEPCFENYRLDKLSTCPEGWPTEARPTMGVHPPSVGLPPEGLPELLSILSSRWLKTN